MLHKIVKKILADYDIADEFHNYAVMLGNKRMDVEQFLACDFYYNFKTIKLFCDFIKYVEEKYDISIVLGDTDIGISELSKGIIEAYLYNGKFEYIDRNAYIKINDMCYKFCIDNDFLNLETEGETAQSFGNIRASYKNTYDLGMKLLSLCRLLSDFD